MITTETVKELRDKTGISVMQCKKALEEALGDMEKALVILRKHSASLAAKKADRESKSGTIGAYVHSNGAIAAMVVLTCETDFVANNEEFHALARDLAMQVTATAPEFLSVEDVPAEVRQTVQSVFLKEVVNKPKEMQAKIMEGKLTAYFKDKALLDQPFIKDQEITVRDLIQGGIQKFGEKITIAKFTRFSLS